jgi:hypothetical protein
MRRIIPIAVGLCAATVGGWIGWVLVRRDVRLWEAGNYTAGPEMVMVVFLAVVFGAVATFFAWRRVMGPPLDHEEWSLVFPAVAGPRLVGESPSRPRIADLLEPLEQLGYSLEATRLDESAAPVGPAARAEPLAGSSLRIVERNAGAHRGRVVLRVPPALDDGRPAIGFLDLHGALEGPYDELARFVIATLGRLVPGLTFKRMDSALEEEPAIAMRDQLPERPQRLAPRRD